MEQSYKQNYFDKYMKLLPEMMKFEGKRRALCANIYTMTIALILGIIYLFLKFGFFLLLFIVPLSIILILYISEYSSNIMKFKNDFKSKFFGEFLEVFDFIRAANKDDKLVDNEFFVSSSKSHIELDDAFLGCYKNVQFKIVELGNALILENGGAYCGPWAGISIELELINSKVNIIPKKRVKNAGNILLMIFGTIWLLMFVIPGIAIVVSSIIYKNFMSLIHGLLCVIFPSLFFLFLIIGIRKKRKYEKINLEDNKFENKFYVEAEDQIDARYILTPSFMERLNNLKTVFGSEKIWCFVRKNKLTISIATKKDLFEIGSVFTSIKKSKHVEEFYNEITAICQMIEYFKLDEKTGL